MMMAETEELKELRSTLFAYKKVNNPIRNMSNKNIYPKAKSDFKIKKCKELPKPFRKGEAVKAQLLFPGRLPNEMMAMAKDRIISVPNCYDTEGIVRVRIRRTKHNIFLGEQLG